MILRKLKKQNLHSGESLPEVMVSGLLFLMMAAVLQGAVAFGNRAKTKSESIRKENAKICRMLRETPWTDSSETAAYTFVAISPDESQVGTTKLSGRSQAGQKGGFERDRHGFLLYVRASGCWRDAGNAWAGR